MRTASKRMAAHGSITATHSCKSDQLLTDVGGLLFRPHQEKRCQFETENLVDDIRRAWVEHREIEH